MWWRQLLYHVGHGVDGGIREVHRQPQHPAAQRDLSLLPGGTVSAVELDHHVVRPAERGQLGGRTGHVDQAFLVARQVPGREHRGPAQHVGVAATLAVDRHQPAGKGPAARSLGTRLHYVERRDDPNPVARYRYLRAHRRQGRIGEQRLHLRPAHHEMVLVVAGGGTELGGADLVHDAPHCRHARCRHERPPLNGVHPAS